MESAVYSAVQSYDNQEVYKTIEEKSTRLAFSLIKNHSFVDDNKRIGIFVMLMTLKLNGIQIKYSQAELIALGLGVADGSIFYNNILLWIQQENIIKQV